METTIVIMTSCPNCFEKISCSHFSDKGRRIVRYCKDCVLSFLVGDCFETDKVIVIEESKLCSDCTGFASAGRDKDG